MALIWPVVLLLTRVSAFLMSAPVFSSGHIPRVVKIGLVLAITGFFLFVLPPQALPPHSNLLSQGLVLVQEVICGVAMGLAAQLVFLCVQQGGIILAQQMGLTDAEVIDPTSNQENESLTNFLELTFIALFLVAGGHHLLLGVLAKSYHVFPAASAPDLSVLTGAVVSAGSTMMLFALKLAAPSLAAFLVLSVVLAILARALPDMNILFESFPLRMGLGLAMAAAMLPSLSNVNIELANWLQRFFNT